MVNKPLISVVIPARNEENYIGGCLEALSRQDYPNFEVIVIDNGSIDKTAIIAKKYFINVIKEKKVGLSHARNKGFKGSKGSIIARTDADSVPPTDWLSRLESVFASDPKIVAVSGSDEYGDHNKFTRYFSRITYWILFYLTRLLLGHYQLSGPNFAIRKKALQGLSFHTDDNKVHEDMDLACHIVERGRLVFIPSLIMPISCRKLKSDPGHLLKYLKKSFYTYFLHHPCHKRHGLS